MDELQDQIIALRKQVKVLEKTTNDTNNLVHKLHSSHVRSKIIKWIYLGVTIILGFVLYGFLSPFYETLGNIYGIGGDEQTTAERLEAIDPTEIQKLIDFIQ